MKYNKLLNNSAKERLKLAIRNVPDFPESGVQFKDITPILEDSSLFALAINLLSERYKNKIDQVVAIDARGFVFGSALAYSIGAGLSLIRKKGKLPHKTFESSYSLEYGNNTVEIHQDTIKAGQRVIIIDDVLATGGTMAAAIDLVEKLDASIVELAFLIELSFLEGRKKLPEQYSIYSVLTY